MTTFKNMLSKHEATFQVCYLKTISNNEKNVLPINNKQHLIFVVYKQ